MANTNSPFGFRPMSRFGGFPWSLQEYAKPVGDANAIFQFDIVKKVTGGIALIESPQGYQMPTVQTGYQGTPGTTFWQGVSLNFGALSTQTFHLVADQPDIIMIAQAKTGTVIATASHIGKNANISLTTAGSTTTKQSGMSIDGATIATTATLDVRLLKVATIPPNAEGDSAIIEVVFNKHSFDQGVAGV